MTPEAVREKHYGCHTHDAGWDERPLVSVLVLNWNGKRFLRPCLRSLLGNTCPHVELILVDNGSTDESVSLVRSEFPEVRIVGHNDNLGFSQGYNVAVSHAKGRFLIFLNNDTVVKRGWLVPLIQHLIDNRDVGITTSKILFQGTQVVNTAGGYLKLWTGVGELGYGQPEEALPAGRLIEPFYASGAAMAIRRDLFEQLGRFDDRMFAYGEDLDLSWRARLAGYRIVHISESIVYHHLSGTWGGLNPRKVRMVTSHYIRAMLKCLSVMNLLHSLPAHVAFAVVKGLALSMIKTTPAYLVSVVAAFGDVIRDRNEIRRGRRTTQRLRRNPDRVALSSENFGLLDSPWHFWRLLRLTQKIDRQVSGPAPSR